MLIEFTVGNFRSFKDKSTLSLIAANKTAQDKAIDDRNTFSASKSLRLLKSAVIFGPNAGGKSNIILAFRIARSLILTSLKLGFRYRSQKLEPFLLSDETIEKPCHFEFVFSIDGVETRYGFEVDSRTVHAEWCFQRRTSKERRIFTRRANEITIGDYFPEGKGLEHRTRPDTLFLPVVAEFNGPIASVIVQWFRSMSVLLTGTAGLRGASMREVESGPHREAIIRLIKELDLGIVDIQVERPTALKTPLTPELGFHRVSSLPQVLTYHHAFDADGQSIGDVPFNFANQESAGTKKVFALSSRILNSLRKGVPLIIDELDAQLHPLLTSSLVKLFNSNDTNERAQLIFTTHDTNLLDRRAFRRDQIWLADKNRFGASHLRSLVEYKGVRNDGSYEAQYLRGNFGAIPLVGDPETAVEAINPLEERVPRWETAPQLRRSGNQRTLFDDDE